MLWIYDIETLKSIFCVVFKNVTTGEVKRFEISWRRNQLKELVDFLNSPKIWLIGFNNLRFDYPVIDYIHSNFKYLNNLNVEKLVEAIYIKSQFIIKQDFPEVAPWRVKIPQVDLYRIWHFDNKARMTSLKKVEVAIGFKNVQDMPYEHYEILTEESQLNEIIYYCENDVNATLEFFFITVGKTDLLLYKGKNKIKLRQELQRDYGINCLNLNDVKIGEELLIKLYCDKLKINLSDIKHLRTFRPLIEVKDCIPKWGKFSNESLNKNVLEKFKSLKIYDGVLKGVLAFSAEYHGIRIDYGAGGAHACIKSGVYKSDDEWIIVDFDIDAMYPSLEITQRIYPEHLGEEFIDILDVEIVSPRKLEKKKPKEERRFTIVEGFKLSANGSYGKSNEKGSILYDPLYTVKTTVPGQIVVTMWLERICEAIPNATIIQVNTDGITLRMPRSMVNASIEASNEIMEETGLTYEVNYYNQMIIRDVNNYIAEYEDSTKEKEHIKLKGCFEIDVEIHKDSSMRIVPKALKEYYINNIPIEEFIYNNNNILDFTKSANMIGDNLLYARDYDRYGTEIDTKLSKTTRYFVSNKGKKLIKKLPPLEGKDKLEKYRKENPLQLDLFHFLPDVKVEKDRETNIESGYYNTIFNILPDDIETKPINEYNINYDYYKRECYKIVNIINENIA